MVLVKSLTNSTCFPPSHSTESDPVKFVIIPGPQMNLFVDTICQRTCLALQELFPAGEWKTSEIKALIEQPPDAEMGAVSYTHLTLPTKA